MSTKERQRILYNFYIPGKTNAKSPASLCAEAAFESDQKKGKRRTTGICRGEALHLLSQTIWPLESSTEAFVADANANITLLHRAGVVPVRLHRSGTAVRILELYSTSCRAAKSSSPVRILTTRVTLYTKILPSPIWPVYSAFLAASTTASTLILETMTPP